MEDRAPDENARRARAKQAEERARQVGVSPVVAELVGPQAPTVWKSLSITQKREVLRAVVHPRLLPTMGGRAPFNPDAVSRSWLGRPAPIPGVDDAGENEVA